MKPETTVGHYASHPVEKALKTLSGVPVGRIAGGESEARTLLKEIEHRLSEMAARELSMPLTREQMELARKIRTFLAK